MRPQRLRKYDRVPLADEEVSFTEVSIGEDDAADLTSVVINNSATGGQDTWMPPEINSYDDVERILLTGCGEVDANGREAPSGEGELEDGVAVVHSDMREFADRYYNKQHRMNSSRKKHVSADVGALITSVYVRLLCAEV